MLPFVAAAGHSQYAKGARLYLELMMKQVAIDTDIGRMFRKENLHTVRYSTHAWSGIPTDLSIEQTLMRQAKSRGPWRACWWEDAQRGYVAQTVDIYA